MEKWKSGKVYCLPPDHERSRRGPSSRRGVDDTTGARRRAPQRDFRTSPFFTRTIAIPTSRLRRPARCRVRARAGRGRARPRRHGSGGCTVPAHAVGHFPLADLAANGVVGHQLTRDPVRRRLRSTSWRGLLALARRLPQTLRRQGAHAWLPNVLVGDASPWLLSGRTMGIIGVGTLGEAIAVRAKAFGMRVVGLRRSPVRGRSRRRFDDVVGRSRSRAAAEEADVIVHRGARDAGDGSD